jgi:hypothetical protein
VCLQRSVCVFGEDRGYLSFGSSALVYPNVPENKGVTGPLQLIITQTTALPCSLSLHLPTPTSSPLQAQPVHDASQCPTGSLSDCTRHKKDFGVRTI